MKSYLNKKFVVDDPDARVRKDDDLLAFVMENAKPKIIPRNTEISVTDTRLLNDSVFGMTTAPLTATPLMIDE